MCFRLTTNVRMYPFAPARFGQSQVLASVAARSLSIVIALNALRANRNCGTPNSVGQNSIFGAGDCGHRAVYKKITRLMESHMFTYCGAISQITVYGSKKIYTVAHSFLF